LALVLANDFWSTSHEEPFRDEARLRGLEIVYSQTIDPKETETRAIIANLKRHKVDAVLAPLFGPSLVSFIRRHREARSESLINVADGMFEEDIKSIGDAAEGVSATQIWLESAELSTKIKARFGDSANPLQLGLIATGYDAIKHLSALARDLRTKGIAINGESINTALKSFSSNGYLGRLMIAAPPARSGEEVVVVECLPTGEESGKGPCKYRR
jgi:ABC-type branched-subunit amino acid transport system substrate-binding protein